MCKFLRPCLYRKKMHCLRSSHWAKMDLLIPLSSCFLRINPYAISDKISVIFRDLRLISRKHFFWTHDASILQNTCSVKIFYLSILWEICCTFRGILLFTSQIFFCEILIITFFTELIMFHIQLNLLYVYLVKCLVIRQFANDRSQWDLNQNIWKFQF